MPNFTPVREIERDVRKIDSRLEAPQINAPDHG